MRLDCTILARLLSFHISHLRSLCIAWESLYDEGDLDRLNVSNHLGSLVEFTSLEDLDIPVGILFGPYEPFANGGKIDVLPRYLPTSLKYLNLSLCYDGWDNPDFTVPLAAIGIDDAWLQTKKNYFPHLERFEVLLHGSTSGVGFASDVDALTTKWNQVAGLGITLNLQ